MSIGHISSFYHFSEKIKLSVSCESSARQPIHTKCPFYLVLSDHIVELFKMSWKMCKIGLPGL